MAKSNLVPSKIRRALLLAKQTRKHAHAPYSGFHVGAALLANGGKLYSGCNVENASYGGTVCAERIAIFKAVSEGSSRFSDIVVVTDAAEPAFPCAFCLQVMAEFFDPGARVWIANLKGIKAVHKFGELLPKPFGPRQLKKATR